VADLPEEPRRRDEQATGQRDLDRDVGRRTPPVRNDVADRGQHEREERGPVAQHVLRDDGQQPDLHRRGHGDPHREVVLGQGLGTGQPEVHGRAPTRSAAGGETRAPNPSVPNHGYTSTPSGTDGDEAPAPMVTRTTQGMPRASAASAAPPSSSMASAGAIATSVPTPRTASPAS